MKKQFFLTTQATLRISSKNFEKQNYLLKNQ